MKNILILGHKGFIGSYLFNHFKSIDVPVHGLSSTDIDLTENFNGGSISKHIDKHTIIIMCSGIKSDYGNNENTLFNNVEMARNVSKVLKGADYSKFIFFSSLAVYGVDSSNMNITEFSPIIADTYYGLSKYVSERIFLLDQKHNKEKLIIIRTPTVYGFGDKINAHTPSGFLNILREGGEIELWGDGTELREFIFIDDIIYIINKLTHIDYSGILNTGSGCGYSYKEAIDIIAKVLDIEPNVTNKERTKDKIDKVVDPDNLISIIGNVPFTTLYNGIDLMIKHN